MPDLARLAELHRASFQNPRPWPAGEIGAMLDGVGVFLIEAPKGLGFLLGRVVLDEVELLTLAVAPEARRRGIARALMAGFTAEAMARGARFAFLEVAADNLAAQALYAASGYRPGGRRKAYYRDAEPYLDAIVMQRELG